MRRLAPAVIFLLVLAAPLWGREQQGSSRGRLFRSEELGQLEGPDREEWQQPEKIMDALNIAEASKVADLGAGGGWFTIRLAKRVGPNGVVYAEDIQKQMIDAVERRMAREGLRNVVTRLGTPTDPRLPAGELQAVLVVNIYSQGLNDAVTLLRNVKTSLASNGRLGIVDFRPGAGGPGPAPDDRVDEAVVIRDGERAGLKLKSRETFLRYQYLLVFVK